MSDIDFDKLNKLAEDEIRDKNWDLMRIEREEQYKKAIQDQTYNMHNLTGIAGTMRRSTSVADLTPPPACTHDTSPEIAVKILPLIQCAECGHAYTVENMPDGVRLRFRHIQIAGTCSRNMTEFYRPIAHFIKFI